MNIFHIFGFSNFRYCPPIIVDGKKPKTYLQLGFRSPAHKGPYYYAEDFVVPDPRIMQLPIYAPESGVVVALAKDNNIWGDTNKYKAYLNFVTVRVVEKGRKLRCEFYELAHIDFSDVEIYLGQNIKKGMLIGKTGLNGWVTLTNGVVDSHLHFMVGCWLGRNTFRSLKIRYG